MIYHVCVGGGGHPLSWISGCCGSFSCWAACHYMIGVAAVIVQLFPSLNLMLSNVQLSACNLHQLPEIGLHHYAEGSIDILVVPKEVIEVDDHNDEGIKREVFILAFQFNEHFHIKFTLLKAVLSAGSFQLLPAASVQNSSTYLAACYFPCFMAVTTFMLRQ